MNEIEEEIRSALAALSLPDDAFVQCDNATASRVVREAKVRFVLGEPRAWWLSLRHPADVFDYPGGSGPDHLEQHIPPTDARCWFIPEIEDETLPVFDVDPQYVAPVLRECRFFEYYLLGRSLTWLVAENDHNQVVVSRLPAVDRATVEVTHAGT